MSLLRQVADGVLVVTHPFCATTTTVILGPDDTCLIVDPAVTAAEIDDVAAQLAAAGRRVVAGFATHPHWDHLLWRDSLGDAPRYATARAAQTAIAAAEANRAKATNSTDGVDAAPVDRVVGLEPGADRVPWDGPVVEVIEHAGHAPGHAALLVRDAGVLLVGDMLSDLEVPLPDQDAEDPFGDYAAALDRFAAVLDDELADVVVPGHGAVAATLEARRRIAADRDYLADVLAGRESDDARLASAPDWLRREHAQTQELARRG